MEHPRPPTAHNLSMFALYSTVGRSSWTPQFSVDEQFRVIHKLEENAVTGFQTHRCTANTCTWTTERRLCHLRVCST